jgi:LPS export ABC transporter protein LptC
VLAACSESVPPAGTLATPSDSADQVVFGLNHQVTVDGVLRTRLRADTAFLYQIAQQAQLRRLTVTFYSPEGRETSTLTAREGTYQWRTGDMEARGEVLAVTPDNRRLTTTLLRYHRDLQQIEGPEAFVFDAPNRHLEGEGFTADPDFRDVVTRRPRRGTAGDVPLQR